MVLAVTDLIGDRLSIVSRRRDVIAERAADLMLAKDFAVMRAPWLR